MELQSCQMIMLSVWERGKALPIVKVIVVAVPEKVRQYAEKELKAYVPDQAILSPKDQYMFVQKDLGGIIFWPHPTTVFLYVRGERIK